MKKEEIKSLSKGILVLVLYFLYYTCSSYLLNLIGYSNFNLTGKVICNISIEVILIAIVLIIYKNQIINDFKDYKNNFKPYIKKYTEYWAFAVALMIIANIIIINIYPNSQATNQQAINELFKVAPIYIIISSVVLAPIIEELVFRLSFRCIFKNDIIFIILSGISFGAMHIIGSYTCLADWLYIIPYSIPGLVFAYTLEKSNNIFVPMSLHFMHNGLMMAVQVILLFLRWFMKKWLVVLIIFIVVFSSTLIYARLIGTKGLKVKEYKIVNSKITDEYYGLKIAHLSDIHFGSSVSKKDLENIVKKVNLTKPDIIVITGDLLTDEWEYDINDLEILKDLKANLGKYIISGNHDNLEIYNEIIDKIGFTNLNDTYKLIYNNSNVPIIISGISSNLVNDNIKDKVKSFNDYIETCNQMPIYSILLMHEPDYVDNIDLNNYDLILAGHSHGGQVRLPLIGSIITPVGSKKYHNEYYNISGKPLYVSSGIGTSLMRLRLFEHPSFNFYRLSNK